MKEEMFRKQFAQMVGGDEDAFFNRHWRQKILYSQFSAAPVKQPYSCQNFIDDYKRERPHAQSLIVSIDDRGVRRMVTPEDGWDPDQLVEQKGSLVLQALMLPRDSPTMPKLWQQAVDLHYDLCAYLLPGIPPGIRPDGAVAAVDIFYTSGETSTGGHYDTGDVFYFVLDGEKEWTVEFTPDPETVLKLVTSKENRYMNDHRPRNEHTRITVRPGDCLYVPPFTYHRVSSSGPTLAISIGMPTYTEAKLVKTVVTQLETEGLMWRPLPSFPITRTAQSREAQAETRERLQGLLDKVALSISGTNR